MRILKGIHEMTDSEFEAYQKADKEERYKKFADRMTYEEYMAKFGYTYETDKKLRDILIRNLK